MRAPGTRTAVCKTENCRTGATMLYYPRNKEDEWVRTDLRGHRSESTCDVLKDQRSQACPPAGSGHFQGPCQAAFRRPLCCPLEAHWQALCWPLGDWCLLTDQGHQVLSGTVVPFSGCLQCPQRWSDLQIRVQIVDNVDCCDMRIKVWPAVTPQ